MEYKHTTHEGDNEVIHFIQILSLEFLEVAQGWRAKEQFKDKHGEGYYIICYQDDNGEFVSSDKHGLMPDSSFIKSLIWTEEMILE